MKTKELVISQAEFLNNAILWALREKVISKYPLSPKKQVLNKLKKMKPPLSKERSFLTKAFH
ncbi:hypothetical protein CHC179_11660 [Helicobacter pylori]